MPTLHALAAPAWAGLPVLLDEADLAPLDREDPWSGLGPDMVSDLAHQLSRYGHQAVIGQYLGLALTATVVGTAHDVLASVRLAAAAYQLRNTVTHLGARR